MKEKSALTREEELCLKDALWEQVCENFKDPKEAVRENLIRELAELLNWSHSLCMNRITFYAGHFAAKRIIGILPKLKIASHKLGSEQTKRNR